MHKRTLVQQSTSLPVPKKIRPSTDSLKDEIQLCSVIGGKIIEHQNLFCTGIQADCPPVDLYLISEKSIWKNKVRRTGFLVYFKLDFYCLCSLQKSISKLIFAG